MDNKIIDQYEIGGMLFDHCATFLRKYKDIDVQYDIETNLLVDVLNIDSKIVQSYKNKELDSSLTYNELKLANDEMQKLKDNHELLKSRI